MQRVFDAWSRQLKTPMIAVALAVVALSLAPARNPCQAGTVTYNFVEGTVSPSPGATGATMTLISPPASATSGWTIPTASDKPSVVILDPGLFPSGFTGSFETEVFSSLGSLTGHEIDKGVLINLTIDLLLQISSDDTVFNNEDRFHVVDGEWLASASVPEPASAVPAGIALAIGLGLATFRKRNEARRQRPVGPLHANQ
jgi:hypothetical protein